MGKEFFCLSFFCGGGGGRMENKEHLSATREFCFEKVAEKFKKDYLISNATSSFHGSLRLK